jgi:tyrosyl-tRNA synthetase
MTFPLLTTASGAKMGKSAEGAVWLDEALLSPYDFYQYWINCDDRDVEKFLKLFTFLPLAEIERLAALEGAEIRSAKQTLAYEATTISHGRGAAEEAQRASEALFGGGRELEGVPTTEISARALEQGISLPTILAEVGLTRSRGEARRLIEQGGVYVNDERIAEVEAVIDGSDITVDGILLRVGKKRYHRLTAG